MTDDAREEKTLHHAVEGQDSAPREGLEREDAQSSEVLVPREELSATQLGSTSGMWSRGSGDTSGYGGIVRELEFPPLAQRPFGGYFDAVADRMLAVVPDVDLSHVIIHRDQITFTIRREQLLDVMRQLRDDAQLRFEGLMSVSGVHYPHHTGAELHVVYQLLSYTHNRRITLEVTCPDADPHIPSVVSVYPMADYHERETWDMFGVIFDGHPSLTRILMPDDWQGHPQRKDYPLGGIPVEFKGAVVPPPSDRRKY